LPHVSAVVSPAFVVRSASGIQVKADGPRVAFQ